MTKDKDWFGGIPDGWPPEDEDQGEAAPEFVAPRPLGKRMGTEDMPVRTVPRIPGLFRGPRPGYPMRAVGKETLQAGVDVLHKIGVEVICCLLSDAEYFKYYGIDLLRYYRGQGFRVLRFPVPDFGVPRTPFMVRLCKEVTALLPKTKVYVHCSAGQGRTGLALNCLLEYRRLVEGKSLKKLDFGQETVEQANFLAVFRHTLSKTK